MNLADAYAIFGVDKDTNKEELLKKYKQLCKKYHPDTGGNEDEFKKIQEAWSLIQNKNDTYNQGFQNHKYSFVINYTFTVMFKLEEYYQESSKNISVNIPNIGNYNLDILLPIGSPENFTVVKSILDGGNNINLYINVVMQPEKKFFRKNQDIIINKQISSLDAIIGKTVEVELPLNIKEIINVPKLSKNKQQIILKNKGLPKNSNENGDVIVILHLETPTIDDETIDAIKKIIDK